MKPDKRIIITSMLFGACVMLFVALRARFVSHLLAWDEAMALCTVRSFVAQGTDEFSSWFWRHPPLFSLMMALCGPLAAGFAERVEIMAIGLGAINFALLFVLNRKLFGVATALWSCFFLAVIPGAMFFDVWIKSDHGVTTFGLLSLLALYARRHWLAALALGVAFLFKGTAVFYFLGVLGIALLGMRRRTGVMRLAVLIGIPALMCGWWYAIFGSTMKILKFTTQSEEFWQQPWWTYFGELRLELGWPVIGALGLGGLAALARLAGGRVARSRRRLLVKGRKLWPVFVLVPAYVGLSLVQNKTTWIVIALFPAWATLAGVGVNGLLEMRIWGARRGAGGGTREAGGRSRSAMPMIRIAAGTALGLVCAWAAIGVTYDDFFESLLPDHRGASILAKDIVDHANLTMKDGDRVLLTNFHFWGGVERRQPCAVFTYYLVPKVKALMRPHDITGAELYEDVMEYEIDWAIVSPEPGEPLQTMHREFFKRSGLTPKELKRAVVYDTRSLKDGGEK